MRLHLPSVTVDRDRLWTRPATRQRILYKNIVGVHFSSPPAHLNRVYTCSPHLRRPLVVIVPFWGVWWAHQHYGSRRVCSTFYQPRGTFWLSDLVFTGLSDALGLIDNGNLFTALFSIHPHHVYGSVRTCHEFSTFVRWLSHVDIAWLVGLHYGSPRNCLSSLSHSIDAGSGIEPLASALMMSEV